MQLKDGLLLLVIFFSFYVEAQISTELEKKNGFRNIELSDRVDYYTYGSNLKMFKKLDSIAANPFEGASNFNYKYVKPDHEKIGNSKIIGIYVKTLEKKIYQISVFVKRDDNLFSTLKNAYGSPIAEIGFNDPEAKIKLMSWTGGDVNCKFYSIENLPYQELRYYSFKLSEEAESDMKNKVSEKNKLKALKEF